MNIKTTYFGLVALSLIVSGHAFAYTSCVGGTEVTLNAVGATGAPAECDSSTCPSPPRTFCMKNFGEDWHSMNWWSAWTWCKSNGGTMVDFEDVCPGSNPVSGAPCLAWKNLRPGPSATNWDRCAWTTLGSGEDSALCVDTGSRGGVTVLNRSAIYRGKNNPTVALCK